MHRGGGEPAEGPPLSHLQIELNRRFQVSESSTDLLHELSCHRVSSLTA